MRQKTAVFLGSTSFDIGLHEKAVRTDPRTWPSLPDAMARSGVALQASIDKLGFRAGFFVITTACTSSAVALTQALRMIRAGLVDNAVVAGVELYNDLTLHGFLSMGLLEPEYYRPFDRDRKGVILGEGAAAVVLGARSSRQNGLALRGAANICDTHNITTHAPEGDIVAACMIKACADSGIAPQAVCAIKCHGTGTQHNDSCEAAAIKKIYTEAAPKIFGLKPWCGHTLGAAGVIELVLCCYALNSGIIPYTPGFSHRDPLLGVAPSVNVSEFTGGNVMLNYFGFGGNCASIIVSRGDSQ